MYRKILVPLDGSNLAETILDHARKMVNICGASEIILLTVVEPFREQPFRKEDDWNKKIQKEAVRVAGNYLKSLQDRLLTEGIKANVAVLEGDPAHEILNYSIKNNIELIMINSKGKTAGTRTVFGKVADRIIRHSSIPVLVAQGQETGLYNRILLPLDGSVFSESVINHVKALAQGCKTSSVALLFVVESPERTSYEVPEDWLNESMKAGFKFAQNYLKEISEDLGKSGILATTTVLEGNPADIILSYIKRENIDLVMISTHGRSGITRWVFGSVAHTVIHHSPVPVLMVAPAGARTDLPK